MKKIKIIILFLLVILIMSGCAERYIPTEEKMIPTVTRSNYFSSDKMLRLESGEELRDEKTEFWTGDFKIDPEFEDALRKALTDSGIFKQIVTDQKADYQLKYEILSQEVQISFKSTATVFIYYSLIEITTNQVVWEESLVSQYSVGIEKALERPLRARLAKEGAVRDNLSQLLEKLSDFFSQLNRN